MNVRDSLLIGASHSWHPGLACDPGWPAGTGGWSSPADLVTAMLRESLRYAVPSLNAGSGGIVVPDPRSVPIPSGYRFLLDFATIHGATMPAIQVSLNAPKRLAAIRHHFSLTITDLGKVLGVERPTVYAWIAAKSRPRPHNLDRIGRVYDLARAWRVLSKRPLGSLLHEPIEGSSVLELLSLEDLPEARIKEFLCRIAETAEISEALPRKKRRLSDAVREHGFREMPGEASQESFDQETSF